MENEQQTTFIIGKAYYLYSHNEERPHFVGNLTEIDSLGWMLLENSKAEKRYVAKTVLLFEASREQISLYF